MLVCLLDRALPLEESSDFVDWVEHTYDALEELGDDAITESIEVFRSSLLTRCVDMLDRMPAADKFRFDFCEFMTADELSTFQPAE